MRRFCGALMAALLLGPMAEAQTITPAPGGGGGGSGTVNSGTAGQLGYYSSSGTAISGENFATIGQGGLGNASGSGLGLRQVFQSGATTINTYGDSITAGTGATTNLLGYASLLSLDEAATPTNYGLSGYYGCDVNTGEIFNTIGAIVATAKNATQTLMSGTNDANFKGTGTYETGVYQLCHQAGIAWLAVPDAYKIHAQAGLLSGTWAADTNFYTGIAEVSTTNGSSISMTLTTNGGPIYLWYKVSDASAGTFTWQLDGGAATSVNAFTTPTIASVLSAGVAMVRITGVSAGSHTVLVTVTSATGAGNSVSIIGVGSPAPALLSSTTPHYQPPAVYVGGVIRQQSDANAAATLAYNNDALADVNLLKGDGLNVTFIDVRSYVNATTDMANALHPNNIGHQHLRDAWEAQMQFAPGFSGTLTNAPLQQNNPIASGYQYYINPNLSFQHDTSALNPGVLAYLDTSGNEAGMDMGWNATTNQYNARIFGVNNVIGVALSICNTANTTQAGCSDKLWLDKASGNVHVAQALENGASGIIGSATLPTIASGFGTSPVAPAGGTSNGTWAFQVTIGTGGTATSGVLTMPAALHGWNCSATDETTTSATAFVTKQTADTTTSVTLGNFNTSGAAAAWNASDVLQISCVGR